MSTRALLNVVYAMVVEGADEESRKRIDATLVAPLNRGGRAVDAARRMAAFAAVGRAEVVR